MSRRRLEAPPIRPVEPQGLILTNGDDAIVTMPKLPAEIVDVIGRLLGEALAAQFLRDHDDSQRPAGEPTITAEVGSRG